MHEHTFTPRYYECDPYNHLNHAYYLRYAMESIRSIVPRRIYVTRASLEFLRPAGYHKPLNLRTGLVAESELTAVYQCDFFDETNREAAKVRVALSYDSNGNFMYIDGAPEPGRSWKEPPSGAFRTKRRVRWYHLNPEGHLDGAWYLSLIEDVVIDAATSVGWSMDKAQQAGIGFFARSLFLEIGRPLTLHHELAVTTYIAEIGNTSVLRENRMQINDETVARSQIWWVFVDLPTGRPCRMPDTWMKDFADQICKT
jgi:YbgC/YbaW family acyl-CoA thioester hydrolase